MSRLYKENLFYAHIVRIDILRISCFEIVIKVDHLLDGCIELPLVPTVEISSCVLELANLGFYLVKILSHLVLVSIVGLCNCL